MTNDTPSFHKLQISHGRDNPVAAIIKDENEKKIQYKYRFTDTGADFTEPGEIEPNLFLQFREGDAADEEFPTEQLAVAADGIEHYTKFTVRREL